jgi:hypothetical protein
MNSGLEESMRNTNYQPNSATCQADVKRVRCQCCSSPDQRSLIHWSVSIVCLERTYYRLHGVSSHSARQKVQTFVQLTEGVFGKLIVALVLDKFFTFYGAPRLISKISPLGTTLNSVNSLHAFLTCFVQLYCVLVAHPKLVFKVHFLAQIFRVHFCFLHLYHLILEEEILLTSLIQFF